MTSPFLAKMKKARRAFLNKERKDKDLRAASSIEQAREWLNRFVQNLESPPYIGAHNAQFNQQLLARQHMPVSAEVLKKMPEFAAFKKRVKGISAHYRIRLNDIMKGDDGLGSSCLIQVSHPGVSREQYRNPPADFNRTQLRIVASIRKARSERASGIKVDRTIIQSYSKKLLELAETFEELYIRQYASTGDTTFSRGFTATRYISFDEGCFRKLPAYQRFVDAVVALDPNFTILACMESAGMGESEIRITVRLAASATQKLKSPAKRKR